MKLRQKTLKNKNRSGTTPCEICSTATFLENHHINGRNIDKPNHKDNLVSICPTCHNEVHHGKIIIEGWFSTSTGRELIWRVCGSSVTDRESNPYIIPQKTPPK